MSATVKAEENNKNNKTKNNLQQQFSADHYRKMTFTDAFVYAKGQADAPESLFCRKFTPQLKQRWCKLRCTTVKKKKKPYFKEKILGISVSCSGFHQACSLPQDTQSQKTSAKTSSRDKTLFKTDVAGSALNQLLNITE